MKIQTAFRSLPLRERGLKLSSLAGRVQWCKSLPLRERGLKLLGVAGVLRRLLSLPLRERGLKSGRVDRRALPEQVAPFTGAWIEITRR